jgi:hypothetical protein
LLLEEGMKKIEFYSRKLKGELISLSENNNVVTEYSAEHMLQELEG